MRWADLFSANVGDILILFVAGVLAGFAVPGSIAVVIQRERSLSVIAILLVLAIIGACAGVSGGLSRTGAVGTVIPAFLGLLGGLSIYLFGIDTSKGLIASFGASALAIALVVSYTLGAQYRNIGDDHREIRAICAKAYTDSNLLSDEVAYARFAERLDGLCSAAMNWHIASSRSATANN